MSFITLAPGDDQLSAPGPEPDSDIFLGPGSFQVSSPGPSFTLPASGDWVPRISAAAYDRTFSLNADLSQSFARSWQDVLNDTGSGSVSLQNDDSDLSSVSYGDVVIFRLDGQGRFAMLVEQKNRTSITEGEEHDETTVISGRGTLALMEEAVVEPVLGVNRNIIQETRYFNFASPDYDDSFWGAPSVDVIHAVDDSLSANVIPDNWPDAAALKMWQGTAISDGINPPLGDVYFRQEFTVSNAGNHRIYCTGDDTWELWVNGDKVFESRQLFGFGTTFQTDIYLDTGTHLVAIKGTNLSAPPGPADYAWVLCSIINLTETGEIGAVVVRSDGSWKALGYPPEPPGFTPGDILIHLVDEAQTRGALVGLSLGFTRDNDSNGDPWPITSDVALAVGSDLLSVVKQLCETYIDVRMAVGSFTLYAYTSRGSTSAAAFQRALNITNLTHDGTV